MFHLYKASRVYSGRPYCGPTSDNKPAEYDTFEEAQVAAATFQEYNPVGWNIFDGDSGELLSGYDFFSE